ncbi:MAG: hypothetical protein V7644_1645 [Actinomycetota bacterium]
MTPPAGPPSRHVSRRRILARRLAAVTALIVAALVAFVLVKVADRADSSPPPVTTAALPAPKPLRIVFPEGFTRRDMAARVRAVARIARHKRHVKPRLSPRAYLAATRPQRIPGFGRQKRPLEGFLFPATYDFLKRTTSAQLVRMQLQAFQRTWQRVKLGYARSKNLTPYDVLIIASMIEKEAVAARDRPKIARVIYNRLHLGMSLGVDATIRYALHIPGTKSLTESALHDPTPYNTRRHGGLPPTPISNPGLASIRAAAHPARGPWLYFVAAPDKVHTFFTSSLQAFERYKAQHGYR